MSTATIRVDRIHCSSCERTITTALGKLDGVSVVRADAATNRVRVQYDEARIGEDQLRTALSELGYQPTA